MGWNPWASPVIGMNINESRRFAIPYEEMAIAPPCVPSMLLMIVVMMLSPAICTKLGRPSTVISPSRALHMRKCPPRRATALFPLR